MAFLDDFKYLSQEFDNEVLGRVKQLSYSSDLYEHMSDFKKFKEKFLSNEKFYNSLTGK